MKLIKGTAVWCLMVGAGLLVTSFAFQAAPPAADGGAIFRRQCAMCHGADGKGFHALKTPNFTDPKWQSSKKDNALKEVIKNGRKGTAMPTFGGTLKDDQISAVISFVRSLNSAKKK